MIFISKALCKSYPLLISRSFHATHSIRKDSYQRLMFKLNGYHKYGILKDDLLFELIPEVAEAIRRLPEEEQMQRLYRAIRAQQAEINNSILPEEQWTKFEDNHNYLTPYVEEILKEKEEMNEWEANH